MLKSYPLKFLAHSVKFSSYLLPLKKHPPLSNELNLRHISYKKITKRTALINSTKKTELQMIGMIIAFNY